MVDNPAWARHPGPMELVARMTRAFIRRGPHGDIELPPWELILRRMG